MRIQCTLVFLRVFWPSRRIKNIYILWKYGDGMHCLDTFRIWEVNVAKAEIGGRWSKTAQIRRFKSTNKRCLHHVRISLLFILKYCKANQVGDEHYSLVSATRLLPSLN
nr:hypothetical protein CFP56_55181 [Quercus suber]